MRRSAASAQAISRRTRSRPSTCCWTPARNINARVTDSRTHTAKITAYVQGRDHEGQTALFAAAESGWDQVVKHLLDRGADPTLQDASGKTALDYAKAPRPAGPGAQTGAAAAAAAARASTVAYLESLGPKPAPTADTAMVKP